MEIIDVIKALKNAIRNDDGATMVEYGIMLSLIAGVCILIVATLGTQTQTLFNTVSSAF